jgi:hypothetical protein
MRKKTQTLTARENPNPRAIYSRVEALGTSGLEPTAPAAAALAICAAEKAKNRKRKVPMNSPTKAMKWLRTGLGSHSKPIKRRALEWLASPGRAFMPGSAKKMLEPGIGEYHDLNLPGSRRLANLGWGEKLRSQR